MKASRKLTHIFFLLLLLGGMKVATFAQNTFPASSFNDQHAGWLLVYPYYTSNSAIKGYDTEFTLTNVSNSKTVGVHLYFMDGKTCSQADMFVCLTPNASTSFRASEMDPDNTGYILAHAIAPSGNNAGYPDIFSSVLIGSAFVNIPTEKIQGMYGAEAYNGTSQSSVVPDPKGDYATLTFSAPCSFAIEVQSPVDVPGQKIVMAGIKGDMSMGLTGAGQVGVGAVYNGNETPFGSFGSWLQGNCTASATITTTSPRVPYTMRTVIPPGQIGTIKIKTGASVGLLMIPANNGGRSGIRTLHKIGFVSTTITNLPLFMPSC